jgi:acyl-CoA synthetase (AMP-forming)/AMP-acid ligase II
MRNILSPVLSGGCVIACSGFDPLLFWDVLTTPTPVSGHLVPDAADDEEDEGEGDKPRRKTGRRGEGGGGGLLRATWYYAAPTMHHAILMEAERRPLPLPVASVRFIANAAGGLLPVLAESLRATFGAVILTSYGMTECMPISSPPQTYRLDPTGTSGIAVGPDIKIADTDDGAKALANGVKGNIMVRGPPCFGGYENNGSANEESFFVLDGEPGWFNTGDMGYLDDQGYLFISGRSKEIINRGGETISPFEIEEAVVQHPCVKECLAFSAPHEQFQETVGCIIVTKPGMQRVDLPALHRYLDDKLHRSKWPYVLVYSDALPKNAANKILRIKYAERTG